MFNSRDKKLTKKHKLICLEKKNVDLNSTINYLRTNELAEQQLKKINSATSKTSILVKEMINNVMKKTNKLLVTIHISFVIRNMNLVKNFVQLGGKSVNCAKLKITLKVALFAKTVKDRERLTKIIRQILQKVMIIVQTNHSLQ